VVAGLTGDLEQAQRMGRAGRAWVAGHASPAAVAERYELLVSDLGAGRSPDGHR
jgi:hypothetical protein